MTSTTLSSRCARQATVISVSGRTIPRLSLVNGGGDVSLDRHSKAAFSPLDLRLDRYHEEESPDAASSEVIQLSPDSTQPAADMTQQQKIAAALRKAGVSNPAAWAAAGITPTPRTTTIRQTETAIRSNAFDPHPPVVLMKGKNNPTFLISWRSQQEIARSLGWKCTLMIWGGPVSRCYASSLYSNQSASEWLMLSSCPSRKLDVAMPATSVVSQR